jgi:hypothetical protein
MFKVPFIYLTFGVIVLLLSALVSALGSTSVPAGVLAGLIYFAVMYWYTWDMYTRGPSFKFGAIHMYVVSCALLSTLVVNTLMARAALVGMTFGLIHASLNKWRERSILRQTGTGK